MSSLDVSTLDIAGLAAIGVFILMLAGFLAAS